MKKKTINEFVTDICLTGQYPILTKKNKKQKNKKYFDNEKYS